VITVEDLLQFVEIISEANRSSFQSEPRLYKSHHYWVMPISIFCISHYYRIPMFGVNPFCVLYRLGDLSVFCVKIITAEGMVSLLPVSTAFLSIK
jgi:hypothetical protein